MESDAVAASEAATDDRVMAAVEDGPVERFVLADVSRDEAFLTCPVADATSLDTWR